MLGNGAIGKQALGQFPPLGIAISVILQYPPMRTFVPFLRQVRAALPGLTQVGRAVPFLRQTRRTPPKLDV